MATSKTSFARSTAIVVASIAVSSRCVVRPTIARHHHAAKVPGGVHTITALDFVRWGAPASGGGCGLSQLARSRYRPHSGDIAGAGSPDRSAAGFRDRDRPASRPVAAGGVTGWDRALGRASAGPERHRTADRPPEPDSHRRSVDATDHSRGSGIVKNALTADG